MSASARSRHAVEDHQLFLPARVVDLSLSMKRSTCASERVVPFLFDRVLRGETMNG